MSFDAQNNEIKSVCKDLLEKGTVDVIIAYQGYGVEGLQPPFFVRKAEQVNDIEWGERAYQNLAPYLLGRKDKVGILAKPCDVRAIVQLIIEQQVKRENIYIIGIECPGIKKADGTLRPGCGDCKVHTPPIYDTLIKDSRIDSLPAAPELDSSEDLAKNLAKFQAEIEKCILCYSCRQACYACYCKNCFIERDIPDWRPTTVDEGTKMTFHMGRVMHLSGRCVECGSCEAACASGVNVRYIIKEVTNFIDKTYGYKTGMDIEATPALLTYLFEDKEIGFLGGEKHE